MRDHHALVAVLHARACRPFDWGKNDRGADAVEAGNSCVHFAAAAILAQTGRNVMAELPRWTSERGAKAALARAGGLEAATDAILRRIPVSHAQRGDIALVRGDDGAVALMVVEGKTLVGPDASGARRLRRERMAAAWSAA